MIKGSLSIVTVGAHPDDIEFGALGTLKLLKERGHKLHFVTMSAGSMGSPKALGEDIEAIRYHETKSSAQKLDATYSCLGQKDFEISDAPSSVKEVVRVLRRYKANIVITHPRDDYMFDHERTHRAVRAAANQIPIPRYSRFEVEREYMPPALKSIPHLYYWSPTGGIDLYGDVFPAHFLIALTDKEMEVKREALATHASQKEWLKTHYGVDEYIPMMEKWAGLWIPHFGLEGKTSYKYAEAFCQDLSFGFPRRDILREILEKRVLPTKNYKLPTKERPKPCNRFLE